MVKMLALDLGTQTGWATLANGLVNSGTVSFAYNSRYEGGGMRYLKFERWLDEMRTLVGFEVVNFEEVMQRAQSVAAGHVYGGFLACLTKWCEANGIPYAGIPVGTIKKHVTGKGNSKKDAMIRWAKEWQGPGVSIADDNQADALALLKWMIDHATTSTPDQRPAPDSKPKGRVPLAPVPVARRRFKV